MPQEMKIRKELSGKKTCLSRVVIELNKLSKLTISQQIKNLKNQTFLTTTKPQSGSHEMYFKMLFRKRIFQHLQKH